MSALKAFWLRINAAVCQVDAHLALQRGDKLAAADFQNLSYHYQRAAFLLDLNRRMS